MSIKALSATISAMKDSFVQASSLMKAREKLADVTPLKRDCGRLCASACCAVDETGRGGMLLFPGEEAFYQQMPPGFAITQDDSLIKGGRLLTCEGVCQRETRPLACRVFPLMFEIKDGQAGVKLDPRAWAICPLMEDGQSGLWSEFVDASLEAAAILMEDKPQRAFILAQQQAVEALCRPLWQEEGQA